jgi:cyclophilin family peptidyl-prolyl cis-trans isomerase
MFHSFRVPLLLSQISHKTPFGSTKEEQMPKPTQILVRIDRIKCARHARATTDAEKDMNKKKKNNSLINRRRSLIIASPLFLDSLEVSQNASSQASSFEEDVLVTNNRDKITAKVFFDVGVCETIVRAERALGGDAVCNAEDALMLGRVCIDLYGNRCPDTVRIFKDLVLKKAYDRTVFHDVRRGEFIAFGLNGSKRLGQVSVSGDSASSNSNRDLASSEAFGLEHFRSGTVSLALSYDGSRQASPSANGIYTEIIVTTGPSPQPELDGRNLVFGIVERESLSVINKIAEVSTFSPSSQVRAWNAIANFSGDERAKSSKLIWSKPTKAIAIFSSGVIEL